MQLVSILHHCILHHRIQLFLLLLLLPAGG
jgi:hypothetical protein